MDDKGLSIKKTPGGGNRDRSDQGMQKEMMNATAVGKA